MPLFQFNETPIHYEIRDGLGLIAKLPDGNERVIEVHDVESIESRLKRWLTAEVTVVSA